MAELPRRLHDFELGDIQLNYRKKSALLHLKDPSPPGTVFVMRLFGLRCFRVGLAQPWGGGCYVADSAVERRGEGYFVELVLNSGDVITAECENMEWSAE